MLEALGLELDFYDELLLKNISFTLKAGDLLHLRGANGAGKTTLLRVLAGLLYPSAGEICYQGKNIHADLISFQRNLCFIGHSYGFNPLLTVEENIRFDVKYDENTQHFEALLEILQLKTHSHHLFGQLSAGQKRRVSLLRLFMCKTALWILDEPFIALDTGAIDWLIEQIENHCQQGGAVLMTSHQPLSLKTIPCQEYYL